MIILGNFPHNRSFKKFLIAINHIACRVRFFGLANAFTCFQMFSGKKVLLLNLGNTRFVDGGIWSKDTRLLTLKKQ